MGAVTVRVGYCLELEEFFSELTRVDVEGSCWWRALWQGLWEELIVGLGDCAGSWGDVGC